MQPLSQQIYECFEAHCGKLKEQLEKRYTELQPHHTAKTPAICLEDIRTQQHATDILATSVENLANQLIMNDARYIIRVYVKRVGDFIVGDQLYICADYTI